MISLMCSFYIFMRNIVFPLENILLQGYLRCHVSGYLLKQNKLEILSDNKTTYHHVEDDDSDGGVCI